MPSTDAVTLPQNVMPRRYRLRLQPDLDSFTFSGDQAVDIEILEPTSSITLNAMDLWIRGASVNVDGTAIAAGTISLDSANETATLEFGQELPTGPARLDMSFTGVLNDKLLGFYRSEYVSQDGQARYLATTQFEATDARRAFPCWDEPARKASFDVTLVFAEGPAGGSQHTRGGGDQPRPRPEVGAVCRDPCYVNLLACLHRGGPGLD